MTSSSRTDSPIEDGLGTDRADLSSDTAHLHARCAEVSSDTAQIWADSAKISADGADTCADRAKLHADRASEYAAQVRLIGFAAVAVVMAAMFGFLCAVLMYRMIGDVVHTTERQHYVYSEDTPDATQPLPETPRWSGQDPATVPDEPDATPRQP